MVIGFHNPDEENGYLSNWYLSDFVIDDVKFSSMEQYMMYKKAICFHDSKIAAQIMQTDDVAKIKSLGRMIHGYDDRIWNGIRQIVVYDGLIEKFLQNEKLKKQLLSTKNTILAECAVNDKIWGIGLSMKDPNHHEINNWKGQNLLGFALMKIREKLTMRGDEE